MSIKENISIKKESQCCGCKACGDICPTGAISFIYAKDGFVRPVIENIKCISCGKCLSVCPFHNVPKGFTPLLTYAVSNMDRDVVKNSSSGGVFRPLAVNQLNEEGFVAGCILDDSFKVKHILSDSKEDLFRMQKSKYVQSDLSGLYAEIKNIVKLGRSVLFSGTPCEIAALKNVLDEDQRENVLFVDIVCHGTPNQQLFDDYLHYFEKRTKERIKKYIFRAKKAANDGMNWYSAVQFQNGSVKFFNWPMDSYCYYYMIGALNRSSCYSCPYCSLERQGDITLCDFWSWEKYHEGFFEPGSQVSGVMLNTKKGVDAFNKLDDKHRIVAVQSTAEHIAKHNSCLVNPLPIPNERTTIFNIYSSIGFEGVDKYFRKKHWKSICKYSLIMHFPGILRLKSLKR